MRPAVQRISTQTGTRISRRNDKIIGKSGKKERIGKKTDETHIKAIYKEERFLRERRGLKGRNGDEVTRNVKHRVSPFHNSKFKRPSSEKKREPKRKILRQRGWRNRRRSSA